MAATLAVWITITDDLLLVSRQGRPLPTHLIRRLQATLAEAGWPGGSETKTQLKETL